MSEILENYDDVSQEIVEATPEQCKPCYRPGLYAHQLAERVMIGEVSIEEAKTEQTQYFEDSCRYGAEKRDRSFGGVVCNLGLLCKFPA